MNAQGAVTYALSNAASMIQKIHISVPTATVPSSANGPRLLSPLRAPVFIPPIQRTNPHRKEVNGEG
jgi:hypothetical protein